MIASRGIPIFYGLPPYLLGRLGYFPHDMGIFARRGAYISSARVFQDMGIQLKAVAGGREQQAPDCAAAFRAGHAPSGHWPRPRSQSYAFLAGGRLVPSSFEKVGEAARR